MHVTSMSSSTRAFAALREADRLIAEAVGLLARTDVEADTGMPAEFGVRLQARRTSWEAREALAVADALRSMPSLRACLADATLSWSQCRAVVRAARDVRAPDRHHVDTFIGKRAPELLRADPDHIVREVEDVCARLRIDLEQTREQRRIETSFLVLRPMLTGGGSLYGEADAERFTSIAEALDAAADTPEASVDGDEPTVRARQHMDALVEICESSLAGGSGGRARPRMLATFDVATIESDGAKILWPLPGRAPRLTPLSTSVAVCDADIVAVAMDGAEPVAVGDPVSTVPAKLRTAVLARDRGCRFPGCGAPARWSDVHHIRWRSAGGTHDLSNLILLCRRCHRRVHGQGWLITFEPDGSADFRSRGRRWISPRRE